MASERRKKIVLVTLSVVMTLLFAEAALRILGIGRIDRGSPWFAGGNHPRFLFQQDPVSGYTLRPGFQGREVAPGNEFDIAAAIDAGGLRDHPHTAGPRPAVLALGDSMTFGEGVPVDRTWSATLERESGIRVYNAGVPGYSTRQMAGRASHLIPRLKPDLVLATFSTQWDRHRSAAPFTYLDGYIVAQGYLGRLHPIGGNLYLGEVRWPVVGAATAYAKRYSHLARIALPAIGDRARALSGSEQEKEEPPGPEDYEPTARALADIRAQAGRAGAGFLAVLIESDRSRLHAAETATLAKILRARGIPFVVMRDLVAIRDWRPLRYPLDQHWNEAGHLAAGKALAPVVSQRLR